MMRINCPAPLRKSPGKRLWTRLVVSFFALLILSPLLVAALPVTPKADAAGEGTLTFKISIPTSDNGSITGSKNEGISCSAYLSKNSNPVTFFTPVSGDNVLEHNNAFPYYGGPLKASDMSDSDYTAASTLFHATTNHNLHYKTISFGGSEDCKTVYFVQSAPGSALFYGVVPNSNGASWQLHAVKTTVSSSGTISFVNPASDNSTVGAFHLNGYTKPSDLGVSGGGVTGGGCPDKFSQISGAGGGDKQLHTCLQSIQFKTGQGYNPFFVDFQTICFGGETFKAPYWIGDGAKAPSGLHSASSNHTLMKYSLTTFDDRCGKEADPNWVKSSATPAYLEIPSLNIDGQGSGSLDHFQAALTSSGLSAAFRDNNANGSFSVKDGDNETFVGLTTISQDPSTNGSIRLVAGYYGANTKNATPDTIVPFITAKDKSNEALFAGTYQLNAGQTTGTGRYAFNNVSQGGKCAGSNQWPYFSHFSKDLTSAKAGEIVSASWTLTDNTDDGCTKNLTIPISIKVMDDNAKPTAPPSSGTNGGATKQDCESGAGQLGWIMCAVIDSLADAVNGIYTQFIVPMMKTPSLTSSSSQGATLKKAWSTFRVFGNIFLVIVVLIVVFGESIGGGMLDAYTIKKILPRILIAAIMINLSFYVTALFIDLSNVIGDGLRLLITTPFGLDGNDFDLKTVNGAAQGGFLGISAAGIGTLIAAADGAAIVGGFITLIFVILPMLLLLFFSIMAVLALRLGLIYALVLASPIAFALWVLPNTEKFFKKWFELLQTTAMVFPIVSGLFGLSMVLAQTTVTATGGKGFIGGAVGYILALVIVVMPLILIPFAFKLAGGILGRAYELASNGRSMGNNFFKKRGELRKQRMQNGTFFNPAGKLGNSKLGRSLNTSLQRNAIRAANENDEARGSRFGRSSNQKKIMDDAIMARKEAHRDAYVKQMKALYGGDENKIRAAMEAYDSSGNFDANKFRRNLRAHNVAGQPPKYTEDDIEGALTKVQRTRTQMGDTAFSIASAQAMMSNGTTNADDNEKVMGWISRATHGDKQAGINFMLAAAEEAKAAGRVDQWSSSPSDNIRAYLHETGVQVDKDITAAGGTTEWLLKRAKETRSPGELAMMKGDGIERMAPLMVKDVHEQQFAVAQTQEFKAVQATKQGVAQTEQALSAARTAANIAAQEVANAEAQVTFGGEATQPQQDAINIARQKQQAANQQVVTVQRSYDANVRLQESARDALEKTSTHKELMHQLARVKGMEDIASQIPDGKAKAYVETTFSAGSVVGVDAQGNAVYDTNATLSKAYNSREVTSNETFRQYHREYTDAESLRSVAAQAAANAAAGGAVNPPGGPAMGPGGVSDSRLKRDIRFLRTTAGGINLYRFQYLWSSQVYVGVMAQDLIETHPEALSQDDFGFYRVDYTALGLQMMTLDQWRQGQRTQAIAVQKQS